MKKDFRMKLRILAAGAGAACLAALIGPLHLAQLRAQSQTSSAGYEAASIKRSTPDGPRRGGMEFLPGGRFRSTNMPFLMVLGTAYGIPTQSIESVRLRIRGMPDWMLSELYDIEATAERGSAAPGTAAKVRNERIRLMLQAVLADRLKLRVRRDSVEMPVYAMVVGTRGPAMEKARIAEQDCAESAPFSGPSASGPGCHQFQGGVGRGLLATAVTMPDLALYVSNWSDLPIVDQTRLPGLYAVKTEGWNSTYSDDPSRPTIDEVFERLGLKLVRRKAPVEVLVIEHVEKPSGN
jgi:uncharacterized protein (TIGR03435 family)